MVPHISAVKVRQLKAIWEQRLVPPYRYVSIIDSAKTVGVDRKLVSAFFKTFEQEVFGELMAVRNAAQAGQENAAQVREENEDAEEDAAQAVQKIQIATARPFGNRIYYDFPEGIDEDIQELANGTQSRQHASFVLQVRDPERKGDRKADCVHCEARYVIFGTGEKARLIVKNIERHLPGCSIQGKAAFDLIVTLDKKHYPKENYYGNQNGVKKIGEAGDNSSPLDEEDVDRISSPLDTKAVALIAESGLKCFCGEQIIKKDFSIRNGISGTLVCHFSYECDLFLTYQGFSERLELDVLPNLTGMKLVDPSVTEPRATEKKFAAYAHYVSDEELYSYVSFTEHLMIRAGQHFDDKTINLKYEQMFALVEFDDKEETLDFETVYIALWRPRKNINVGYARLARMSEAHFVNLARVAILAMRSRADYFAGQADVSDSE